MAGDQSWHQPVSTADLAAADAPASPSDDEDEAFDESLGDANDPTREPLVPEDQSDRFTVRWTQIQSSFVDQPRESVEQADALAADLMQGLAAGFASERERLESQWHSGSDVSERPLRAMSTRMAAS